jgi:hypothetical protein
MNSRTILAIAILAVAAAMNAGVLSTATAHEAVLGSFGSVAEKARSASPVVEVARRRRSAPDDTAAVPTKESNGEVLFGVQDVGFLVDRDTIHVGPEIGKFDRLRLRVLRNDIFINDLKVVYADGETETLLTDTKLDSGRKTNWFDLKHKGFIKEIQLVYRSRPDFKGEARVEIFGEYAANWLDPSGEGQKYNDGWVLLGTDTAGSIGFDKVKIPVGKNDGGFKQIRVSVKDRDVTMTDLAVVYASGDKDHVKSDRVKIEADKAYGPIDLKNGASIKEIQATWRSRAFATSKKDRAYATIEVWGHH